MNEPVFATEGVRIVPFYDREDLVRRVIRTVHLRESIEAPGAKRLDGFDPRDVWMPSYLGVLTDFDVTSLVLFIESLCPTAAR